MLILVWRIEVFLTRHTQQTPFCSRLLLQFLDRVNSAERSNSNAFLVLRWI
jgi:hypothetical protein